MGRLVRSSRRLPDFVIESLTQATWAPHEFGPHAPGAIAPEKCVGFGRSWFRRSRSFRPGAPDAPASRGPSRVEVAVGEGVLTAPMGPVQISPGEAGRLIVCEGEATFAWSC